MRTLISVILFFISFQVMGQTGYHIIYNEVSTETDYTASSIKRRPFKTNIVFNDSFFYRYITEYGKPNAKKKGIYGIKVLPHSDYFSVKENQDYFIQWDQSKRKRRLQKSTPFHVEWRIQKDSVKTIMGYNCTKAWGLIKGKLDYIWFTNEIPFTYGPRYGHPFPGTVLAYEDMKYGKTLIATKVIKDNFKIALPKLKIVEANNPKE